MSTEQQPQSPTPQRRARGPRKAETVLVKAATVAGWDDEVMLLVLGGFIEQQKAQRGQAVSAEHFTDRTIQYAKEMGWSLSTPIKMLCQSVDDAGTVEPFSSYLGEAVKAYQAEMATAQAAAQAAAAAVPAGPPPRQESAPDHVHHYETAEKLDEANHLLSCCDPAHEAQVGAALMAWSFDFPGGLKAVIEVVNGEPVYVDAYMFREGGVVVSLPSHGPLERTFVFPYDGAEYKVTFHRA